MEILGTFNIRRKMWTVVAARGLVDKEGHFVDGLCDFATRTISLNRSQKRNKAWNTYLHELTHASKYTFQEYMHKKGFAPDPDAEDYPITDENEEEFADHNANVFQAGTKIFSGSVLW
jgi:hypothetical protein